MPHVGFLHDVVGSKGTPTSPALPAWGGRNYPCEMTRHHVVPQMYLRRFADSRGQVVLASRRDTSVQHRTSVGRACREVGYYEIPTADLEEDARPGHDPEAVERLLSQIEGAANLRLAELLDGGCPPTPEIRFRLSLFFSLQMTRGTAFRRTLDELASAVAPTWLDSEFSEENIRQRLAERGEEATQVFVDEVRAFVTGPNGPRPEFRQGHYVQHALAHALQLQEHLFKRRWRVLEFETPSLITSDEPVAVFVGNSRLPMGPANARAIWVPIDRQHALAMTLTGSEGLVRSGATRARRLNQLVADQAQRWIICHPEDSALIPRDIGPRTEWRDEIVGRYLDGTEVHEQHILAPRPIVE